MSITWKKGPQAGGAQEVGAGSAPQGSRHGMWTESLVRVAGGWADTSRQAGLPLCSAWGTHVAEARQKGSSARLARFLTAQPALRHTRRPKPPPMSISWLQGQGSRVVTGGVG